MSLSQGNVQTAKVQDHSHMNKLIRQSKRDSNFTIWILAIPMQHVAFGSFSDASCGIRADGSSQGGQLHFVCDASLFDDHNARMSLVDWKSWSLKRVCRSSLSAESQAAADTADTLNFVRLFAADFMMWQGVDLRITNEVLRIIPKSIMVTDCKSLYDALARSESQGLDLFRKSGPL